MKKLNTKITALAVALMLATTGTVTMTAFAEADEAATDAQETVVAEQADEASSFEETEVQETEAIEAVPADDADAVIEDMDAEGESPATPNAATDAQEDGEATIEPESKTAVPDETGLVKIDGAYYMVLEDGTLYRGAYDDDSLKAFFDENDGHMLYGQRKVAGKWYQYSTDDDLWVLMAVVEKTS